MVKPADSRGRVEGLGTSSRQGGGGVFDRTHFGL